MERILLSARCYKPIHSFICRAIAQMLSGRFVVDMCLDKSVDLSGYSALLCFNQRGYRTFNKYKTQLEKIPKFLFFCNSDIQREYTVDYSLFDKIFIILDEPYSYGKNLLSYSHMIHLRIPFFPPETEKYSESEQKKIVFAGEGSILFSMVELVNQLSNMHENIVVVSENKKVKSLLDPSVQFINRDKIDISEFASSAKLIIGDKENILAGLSFGIPCLVAGVTGYGRLVTEDNFKMLYNNGFNGRPGGCNGEDISLLYLREDMKQFLTLDGEAVGNKSLSISLRQEYNDLVLKLNKEIEEGIMIKSGSWNLCFVMNNDFKYYPVEGTAQYCIIDMILKKRLFVIDGEEYAVIKYFEESKTVAEAYKMCGYGTEADFNIFVNELITNKLILHDRV